MPRVKLNERMLAERARELIEQDGMEAFTMRRLAQAVGASPMAVYTYFADKEAVFEAVTQLLLAEVDVPPEDLGWEDATRFIMRSVRNTAARHPNVARLMTRYPPRTVDAMAYVEAGFRAYLRAGFDPRSVARCYRALAVYSIGSIDVELGHYFAASPASRGERPTLDTPNLEKHLPSLASVGPQLSDQDDADEFEYGLDLLIAGLSRLAGGASERELAAAPGSART